MEYDTDHPEDVLKVDATEGDPMTGDDAYDMIRYGMMCRPQITDKPKVRLIPGSVKMIEHNRKLMDDQLQREIDREQAADDESKSFETFGMDGGEMAHYIIQGRRR
jgi:hypothetical protein